MKMLCSYACALTLYLTSSWLQAQTILYFSPGSALFIPSGKTISFDSLVLTPSADFTINGPNSAQRSTTILHPSANPYIKRVYQFSNTLSSYSGDITIYFQDEELNSIPENALTLNVHDGAGWNAYTSNVTRDAAGNYVTTSALNNIALNELTLASLATPLPVHFLLLNTLCNTDGVTLTWKTAGETDARKFHVEKSTDGRNWTVIGMLNATGINGRSANYQFIDKNRSAAGGLYRIAEYDMNNKMALSPILRPSCTGKELFAIFPNPAGALTTVQITVSEASPLKLMLYDYKGSVIKTIQTNLLAGANQLYLDLSGLPGGRYTVSGSFNGQVKFSHLIKN